MFTVDQTLLISGEHIVFEHTRHRCIIFVSTMGRKSLGQLREDEHLEQLPVSRIKTIMKSSPDVEGIRKEALFLVNKATEYFIQFLTSTAYRHSEGVRELEYDSLSEIVRGDMRLSFMADLFPKRITYKEYKEIIAKRNKDVFKAGEDLSWEEEESESDFGQLDDDTCGKTKGRSCNSLSKSKEHSTPRNSSDLSDSVSTNSESILSESSATIREDNIEEKLVQQGKLVEDGDASVVSECDKDDDHDDMEEDMVVD